MDPAPRDGTSAAERWRALVDNSDDTIIVVDREMTIRFINRVLEGHTVEQLLGTSILRYVLAEHHELVRSSVQRAFETGESVSYEVKYNVAQLGAGVEVLWFVTKVVPLTEQGVASGAILVATDITERKLMELRLRAAEERWRSLVENSDDTIHVVDRDGIIRYANKTIPTQKVAERVGTSIYKWVVPEDIERIRATLERVLATGVPDTWETTLQMSAFGLAGEPLWFSVKAIPTTAEGAVSGAILIATNITLAKQRERELRRAKEAAEAASVAKSNFLANTSHEVRTPLNAIIGLTNLAILAGPDAQVADYLRRIRSASLVLLGAINDILDFSRIEARKLELRKIDFDLYDVLEGLDDVVGGEAARKGLELVIDVSPETPRALRGDPARLRQVLTNLVQNAIKFTPSGTVLVQVRPLSARGKTVIEFRVQDTGIGVAEDDRPRLFESFTQVDASSSRRFGGTGLGLAICRGLVELMGGAIDVESRVGVGSAFRFALPLGRRSAERPAAPSVPSPLAGRRVLVVDDNPIARDLLVEMLRALSLRPTAVESGERALAILAGASDDPFSLVLLDNRMPGWGGLETARRIDAQAGGAPRVRKVMLATVLDRVEMRERAPAAGVDRVLLKPVHPAKLLDAIVGVFGLDEPVAAKAAETRSAEVDDRLRGARVLVVEDVDTNQLVAREILERAGVIVEIASDGAEAIRTVRARPFDAVLMDVQMPGMDGLDATRVLRSEEAYAGLPIIAMTAHAMSGDREKCLQAGMDDHVAKPIEADALCAVLAAHLRDPVTGIGARPALERPGGARAARPGPTPGIDLAEIMAQFGEDYRTVHSLLAGFAARYEDSIAQIRAAIAGGDLAAAGGLVHGLLTVAGSLRLRDMYSLVLALEGALRGQGDVGLAVRELQACMTEVLGTIAALPPPSSRLVDVSSSRPPPKAP